MKFASTCEKCEKEYGVHTILAGNRCAWLCTTCLSAWSRHIRAEPTWREGLKCTARKRFLKGLAHGGKPPSLGEWEIWETTYDRIQRELFELADKWLGEKVGKAGDMEVPTGASSDGDMAVDNR